MSQYNNLILRKQNGPIKVDLDKISKSKLVKDLEAELFEQNADEGEYNGEHLFAMKGTKLKMYNGGYDSEWRYTDTVNLWGYDGKAVLKVLAKHLTEGKLYFY